MGLVTDLAAGLAAGFGAALAIFFFADIAIHHPNGVWEEIKGIDFVDVFIGFALGLVLTEVAQKTILKSDLVNRYEIKKKNQKANGKK